MNATTPIINYEALRNGFSTTLTNLEILHSSIILQQTLLLSSNISQASIANGGIITTEVPELNTKFINQIAIDYRLYGKSVLLNNQTALEILAHQCPYQGGKAVYRARYFLSLINDSIEYNDEANCLAAGFWRKSDIESNVKDLLQLSPNPTNNYTELRYYGTIDTKTSLSIENMQGQVVYTQDLVAQVIKINTENFANGVYNIVIKNKQQISSVKKLVVVK